MALEKQQLKESLRETKKDKKEVKKYVPLMANDPLRTQGRNDVSELSQQGDHVDEYLKNSPDIKVLAKLFNATFRKPTSEEASKGMFGSNVILAIDKISGATMFHTMVYENRSDQVRNAYGIITQQMSSIGTTLSYKKVDSDKMGSQEYRVSISRKDLPTQELTLSVPVTENLQTFEEGFLWAISNNKPGFGRGLFLIAR